MASCNYYQYEGGLFGGGEYCLVSGSKERISSDYYNRYCCRDYNMRDCPLYKKYGPYLSSGCFITTITCDILGKMDNDKVLSNMRSFRNNMLQNNKEYYDVLKEYDSIGPIIAFKLIIDEDNEKIATALYKLLSVISDLIEAGKYDEAVEKYKLMTLLLINYYGLKHDYNEEVDSDYHYSEFDPKRAGHGYKTRKLEKENL